MDMKAVGALVAVLAGATAVRKSVPRDVIRSRLTKIFYALGVAMTLGLSKSSMAGPLWNKTLEPVFVDLIEDVSYAVQEGLIKGMKSDNNTPPPPGRPSPPGVSSE